MGGSIRRIDSMRFDDFEAMLADRPREERWELVGGRVVRAMVGARWEHHQIAQNLAFALRDHFRRTGRPCRVFQESFYLKSRALDLAILPDVVVRCGPLAPGATSLDDPVVLAEVLSPATAARDRHDKWELCRRLPSLRHYLLVDSERARLELRSRDGDDWTVETLAGFDAVLRLPAIGFEIAAAVVYEDVSAG